jgi:hypothetical protein
MDPYESLLSEIADGECQRISRKVIRSLQRMIDGLQFGDDSRLVNLWNEICVQVQGEQSVMWDAYLHTVSGFILDQLSRVDVTLKRAIWLQTREGMDWEPEPGNRVSPYADDDIVEYVLHDYVLSAAADWRNARIERYRERSYERD